MIFWLPNDSDLSNSSEIVFPSSTHLFTNRYDIYRILFPKILGKFGLWRKYKSRKASSDEDDYAAFPSDARDAELMARNAE